MQTEINSFLQADVSLSQGIYQAFYNNSVINRKEYLESKADFQDSPKYREIVVNLYHYQQLYWHLGFQLTQDTDGEYFYLKATTDQDNDEDIFDETSLKIMAVLTLIARIATKRGQALVLLGDPVQGISPNDIDNINDDSESVEFIKSLKLKNASDAVEFLRKKGFAFRVNQKRYVLSKGALYMIDTLIQRQKALSGDDV